MARQRKAPRPKVKKRETPLEGPERIYDFADAVQREAAPDAPQGPSPRWETCVTFQLARETFAFEVAAVREIVRVGKITRVPHAPYTVRGIVNLRGRVVPVMDLPARLGLGPAAITPRSRILVAESRGRLLGLLVDDVHQVLRIDRNAVRPPPDDVMTDQSEYITGVADHDHALVVLLDSERVLVIPDGLEGRNRGNAA